MAKAAKSKEEQVEVSSQDMLSTLLNTHKGDHFNNVLSTNRIISTGSLILDSYVKIRSGNVIRLIGKGAELGKTSESFVLAENYMKTMPKAKTLYVKAEGRLSPEMQARTGLKFVFKAEDWVEGTVFVFCTNIFETVANVTETLLKAMHEAGEHLCVIIDSLDGLILKKDYEVKGIDGNMMVAGVPKLTKLLFRRLALPIGHFDAMMIIMGQYSADIKIDPYAPTAPRQGTASGGSAVMHQSDYVLEYGQRFASDYILEKEGEKPDPEKNKILGVWATIEIKKSGSDVTGVKVKIPIRKGRVGSAIWVEKEVVDMLLSYELVGRAGAWYSFTPQIIEEALKDSILIKEKHQGINGLYEYMETDKEVFNWFYSKFKGSTQESENEV